MISDKTSRAKGKLRESKSKLDTILNITNLINENASSNELFSILQDVLISELRIGKFALFTSNNEVWSLALSEGVTKNDSAQINIEGLVKAYDDIGIISEDNKLKNCADFELIIPVFHKEQPLAYMILADFEEDKIEISPIIKHLRFIQTLINIIVVALENKRLNKEQLNQIAIKKELEMAQNMQSLLFPRNLPNNSILKVKALYLPHSEVGGDYYDVVELNNGKIALCVADVSGKGMSAALLMANFQANLRALLSVADSVEELIHFCNQKIIESASYQKFITLFIAIFDPKEKLLTYVNAGHQPAILVNDGEIQFLKKGTTILGMFDQLPSLQVERIKIKRNSKLICFTDGITELLDSSGNQLEAEGIKTLLSGEQSVTNMIGRIKSKIRHLENLTGVDDDITLLAAELLP